MSILKEKSEILTNEEKIDLIEEHFAKIMTILGLDLDNPSLSQTPARIARMYVNEIFSGLDPKNFPEITLFDAPNNHSGMVLVKKITFTSFCEHHFVPMHGFATIAYIPNGKIIGLSKINRLVRFYSKRPQLQERLTQEIASALSKILKTPHVAIHLTATHTCVTARGVEDADSETVTTQYLGNFQLDSTLRSEFLTSI